VLINGIGLLLYGVPDLTLLKKLPKMPLYTNSNLTVLSCKKVLLLKTGNFLSPTLLIFLWFMNLVLLLMYLLLLMLKPPLSDYLVLLLHLLMLDPQLKLMSHSTLQLVLVLLVPILSV